MAATMPTPSALIREGLDDGNDDPDALADKVLRHLDHDSLVRLARRKLRADAKTEMSRRARTRGQKIVSPSAKLRTTASLPGEVERRWLEWTCQTEALGNGVRRKVSDLTIADIDIMITLRRAHSDALGTEIARLTHLREALVINSANRVGDLSPQIID